MKLDKYDIALTNATDKEENRKILQQVFLDKGNLVAADGYMLVIRPADLNDDERKNQASYLIPARILKTIKSTPNHQAELSTDENKMVVSYTDKIGNDVEYGERTSFETFTGTFPNYQQLIPKSTEKKAYIAVDVKRLKQLLSCMPDTGHLYMGITSDKELLEFECANMDRPIRGLLMPMYVDWPHFKWWRPESEASKMSTSVIQCLDCGAWNWADRVKCETCGSENLTLSFHQVLKFSCDRDPEFKKKIDAIYGR